MSFRALIAAAVLATAAHAELPTTPAKPDAPAPERKKKMLPACILDVDTSTIKWILRRGEVRCEAKCPRKFVPIVWANTAETDQGIQPLLKCICCPDF